jgi:hypothetical protein
LRPVEQPPLLFGKAAEWPQMGSGRNPENKHILSFRRYEIRSGILYLVTALLSYQAENFIF